jgi:cytochrome b
MPTESFRAAQIWDLPTRLFHWLLVLLVGTNLFLIGPRGGIETVIHFVAGFAIAGLLLFRLLWGFIGSPRSRFVDFVRPWPTVRTYLDRLRRLQPPSAVGHNPLGGWMIVVLLTALAIMIATGLFASGRHAAGPFAHLVPVGVTGALGTIHSLVANLLIGLICVHIAGVAVEWFLTGENLVKSMVNGRKELPADVAAQERPTVGMGRAAAVGLLCLVLIAALIAATDFSADRASLQAAPEQASSGVMLQGRQLGAASRLAD